MSETQAAQEQRRSMIATPLPGGAVQIAIRGAEGYFSVIADAPLTDREAVGPPPAYLALAGWVA
jgi:hypothetical protein